MCRWHGSAEDANILRNCTVRDYGYNILVGDGSYDIRAYLIPQRNPHIHAELFNEWQIRRRSTIERRFDVWKRFPILALGIQKRNVGVIIASEALHNIACIMRECWILS